MRLYSWAIGRNFSAQLFSYMLLTGCATAIPAPPIVRTVEIKVAVPVPCRVTMPEKPLWELSRTSPDASLFDLVRAAMIEAKQRESYENLLFAAAAACSE